jgi:hypothetical protein
VVTRPVTDLAAAKAEVTAANKQAEDLKQRENVLRAELAQLRAPAAQPIKSTGKRGDD